MQGNTQPWLSLFYNASKSVLILNSVNSTNHMESDLSNSDLKSLLDVLYVTWCKECSIIVLTQVLAGDIIFNYWLQHSVLSNLLGLNYVVGTDYFFNRWLKKGFGGYKGFYNLTWKFKLLPLRKQVSRLCFLSILNISIFI